MTNIEKLEQWFENEKDQNGLKDIKFYPGNVAFSTVNSFSSAVLSVIESEKQDRFKEIKEL